MAVVIIAVMAILILGVKIASMDTLMVSMGILMVALVTAHRWRWWCEGDA